MRYILSITGLFVGVVLAMAQTSLPSKPASQSVVLRTRDSKDSRPYSGNSLLGMLVSAEELKSELSADQYCNDPAVKDQSCFSNAVAALPSFGGKISVPSHAYTLTAGVSITKPVHFECTKGAVIRHDGSAAVQTFVFTGSATGSKITGSCNFEPVSTLTLLSPKGFPNSAYPVLVNRGDGIGYEPTLNDSDIYASLTTQQKNQDVGPFILFQDVNDIEVSGVTGNRITIWATSSSPATGQRINFHDNNFVGGKGGVYGCLGVIGRSGYFGSELSKTIIRRNVVRDCSFSGIFIGNTDGAIIDNSLSFNNGESGIKTFDFPHHPNTRWVISDNTAWGEYYDGIDASAEPSHKARYFTYGTITGNHVYNNNQTGITTDGIGNTVSGNESYNNGTTGIKFDVADGLLSGNVTRNNNTSHTVSGVAEISIGLGSGGNTVIHNRMTHTNRTPGAAGFFATSHADTYAFNVADGSIITFAGGTPLAAQENYDNSGPKGDYPGLSHAVNGKRESKAAVVSPRVTMNGDTKVTIYMGNLALSAVLAEFTPTRPSTLKNLVASSIQAPNGCSVQPTLTIQQPKGTIRATLTLTNFAGATLWATNGLSTSLTSKAAYIVFTPGTGCITVPSGVNFNVEYKVQ